MFRINTTAILIFCLFVTSSAVGQKNLVKVNATALGIKSYALSYERALNQRNSLQIGACLSPDLILGSFDNILGYKYVYDASAFCFLLEYRWYFNKEANLNGFFLSPFVRHQQTKVQVLNNNVVPSELTEKSFSTTNPGMLVGHQWMLFKKRASLDAWAGAEVVTNNSYRVEVPNGDLTAFTYSVKKLRARLGINLGIALPMVAR
jgi:hypothetical protein